MGYKTFSPFIDEAYDLIENDEQRLLAIVGEIKRLCKFTDKEWLDFQCNIHDSVVYNYNRLKTITAKFINATEVDKFFKLQ
jgi:hypothetical protein